MIENKNLWRVFRAEGGGEKVGIHVELKPVT